MGGQISWVNQQSFGISGNFGLFQTNAPTATHAAGLHSILSSGPLPDNQTLEMRADVVGASQDDVWAGLHFYWQGQGYGYMFVMDRNEVGLWKFYNGANALACFFYDDPVLPNENVTLVLALTRRGSNVEITTQVLDKANANAVLFKRTVTDTPEADPVLPNRAVRGARSEPDVAGTPWPVVSAPTAVELTLTWVNPERAPQPAAQVIFDNLEVRQYESPQLTIQNAVVLSWPLTQGQFVVEGAPSVDGPWEPVPEPWSRTTAAQNEVCILAVDGMRFFRLRQVNP